MLCVQARANDAIYLVMGSILLRTARQDLDTGHSFVHSTNTSQVPIMDLGLCANRYWAYSNEQDTALTLMEFNLAHRADNETLTCEARSGDESAEHLGADVLEGGSGAGGRQRARPGKL